MHNIVHLSCCVRSERKCSLHFLYDESKEDNGGGAGGTSNGASG